MPKTTPAFRLGLMVRPIEADYSCSDIQAYRYRVVVISASNAITNPQSSSWGETSFAAPYTDLEFYAQGPVREPSPSPTYAWSVRYRDVGWVDLNDAERMFKMLRKINKVHMPVSAATFGQYVQMMAQALGITDVVQPLRQGSMYSQGEYRFSKITDAQYIIDNAIAEFLKAQNPQRQVA